MKDFNELREGDFIIADGEIPDLMKAVYRDYYANGKKILCLCDTRSIYPASEIMAWSYQKMIPFKEEDVLEIIPTTKKTAVVKLNDGVALWCATDTPCEDANAFCEWLFANGGVNFYHKCERKYASYMIDHFDKEEFDEY